MKVNELKDDKYESVTLKTKLLEVIKQECWRNQVIFGEIKQIKMIRLDSENWSFEIQYSYVLLISIYTILK